MNNSDRIPSPLPVVIEPYDPSWPRRFQNEKNRLESVFSAMNPVIEHIGSTAIPNMSAKPIIDIMVGVTHLNEIESRISDLNAIGYRYVPKHESELPERRYFRKPITGPSTHHLHCVVRDTAFWNRHLLFRNYLREYPAAAADYLRLKSDLARKYRSDRAAYTTAKSTFIESILEKASAAYAFEPVSTV